LYNNNNKHIFVVKQKNIIGIMPIQISTFKAKCGKQNIKT